MLERGRNPDAAFLNLLTGLVRMLRERDVTLFLCGVGADLGKALAVIGLEAQIGASRIFSDQPSRDASRRDAVNAAYKLFGYTLCSSCPRGKEPTEAEELREYVI